MPAVSDTFNYNLLWIRPDWLEKVGLPLPKTVDDVRGIAEAFVEKDPGGNGSGGTIGLCLSYYPGNPLLGNSDQFWGPTPIMNSVGAFPSAWINGKDGKVVYGTVAPETKTGIGILADWYNEGLIDKTFMTHKTVDEVTPYAREGKVGLVFCSWWWAYVAQSADPNVMVDWIPVMAPLNAEGRFAHTLNLNSSAFECVNSKCQYPEAVVKVMNVAYDLQQGGFDDNPEVMALIQPEIEYKTLGRTTSPVIDMAFEYGMVPKLSHSIANCLETGKLEYYRPDISADNKQLYEDALRYSKKPDLTDANGYIAYVGYAVAGSMMDAPESLEVPVVFNDATDSYMDYWANLKKMEEEMEVQIISNQKPLSFFDEFVDQWHTTGGDTITNEVQAVVDQRK